MNLPCRVDYAKSFRSNCRGCKAQIKKDTLRLAIMVDSQWFDGKIPSWHHPHCFFAEPFCVNELDIENFGSLRLEDQEWIREQLHSKSPLVGMQTKIVRESAAAANNETLKNFFVEYAVSSRSKCRGCREKIMKDEVRVSKTDYLRSYGRQDMWHHLNCFALLRSKFQFFESGEKIPGFNGLRTQDREKVAKELPAIKNEDSSAEQPMIKDEVEDNTYVTEDFSFFNSQSTVKVEKEEDNEEYNNFSVELNEEDLLLEISDLHNTAGYQNEIEVLRNRITRVTKKNRRLLKKKIALQKTVKNLKKALKMAECVN